MLLPGFLFALKAKLGLEGDCITQLYVSIQNSNSFNGSVAEAGGMYWLWHLFHSGMRFVAIVKYLVQFCIFI